MEGTWAYRSASFDLTYHQTFARIVISAVCHNPFLKGTGIALGFGFTCVILGNHDNINLQLEETQPEVILGNFPQIISGGNSLFKKN